MAIRRLLTAIAITASATAAQAEPDYVAQASQIACPLMTRENITGRQWIKGGPPDTTADAPFGIPLAAWQEPVWQAFRERAVACNRNVHRDSTTNESNLIGAMVNSTKREVETPVARAVEAARATDAKKALVMSRAREAAVAEGTADEMAMRLDAIRKLVAAPPALSRRDADEVTAALAPLEDRIRTAQLAEAEAWEKGKPERDAKAAAAAKKAVDDERIAKFRREKAEAEASQRAASEAAARRDAQAKADADRASAQRYQQEADARIASEKAEREQAEADRLNAACPVLKTKDAYYKQRLIRQQKLTEDISNNPGEYVSNPGKACSVVNDRLSIFSEMKDDVSACLKSGEARFQEMVQGFAGQIFMIAQQKASLGCR